MKTNLGLVHRLRLKIGCGFTLDGANACRCCARNRSNSKRRSIGVGGGA